MRNPPDHRNIRDFENLKQDNKHHGNGQQKPLRPGPSSSDGVTIRPAKHFANTIPPDQVTNPSAKDILHDISPDLQKQDIDLIQSSFNQTSTPNPFQPDRNGFIHAAVNAYSSHHHLMLRPEDIWLTILTQMSSYINANAEDLRGSFVAHDGKKELIIEDDTSPDRYSFDWAKFSQMITHIIQDYVVDPDLREWMMLNFSATTEEDRVVASIVMMASLQKYFEYTAMLTCGIPSITLLGEKEDYQLIFERLDKLKHYGKEPTQFAELLKPVLKRFVRSFEEPESQEVLSFWNRIFSLWDMGSGPTYYTGWITAFMFWDVEGKVIHPGRERLLEQRERLDGELFLELDGILYHHVSSDDVPPGFATVPVKIVEGSGEIMAEMLAGSVGIEVTSSGNLTEGGERGMDTMQPKSGWWIYEKLEKV